MQRLLLLSIIIIGVISTVASQPSREINKTIPLEPNGNLLIDTYKGTITITCHDKAQVELNVRIESDDIDSFDAEQDVKDTEIKIYNTENQITIKTDYDQLKRNRHHDFWGWLVNFGDNIYSLPSVHYTIKMPRTAELKIKDYKSESYIEGLKSFLTINTYKGNVKVVDLNGGVDLETYKGDVRVSFLSLQKDCYFKTYKGKIDVSLPKKTGFELQTDFEKRVYFNSDFDVDKRGHGKRNRYYDYFGKVNGGGPKIEFSSEKGNIRLRAN